MSIPLNINGAIFEYPENFDENWGVNATGWAQAVTNGMLQRQGGNFPLTADANFGASFGLIAAYYTSRATNPATAGTFRLASADPGVVFRNNANSGNLILTTDSSDNLLYNGHIISPSGAGTVTSITGTANEIIASAATGAITLSTPQAIASTSSPTFASLTLTSPLSVANGGTGSAILTAYAVLTGGTTSTGPLQSVTSVGTAGQVLTSNGAGALPTFTNAPGMGTVNSGIANQLAYYATSGTSISGLTAITASRGVVSDANGLPVASTTTAAELGFVSGVTSAIQTQLNGKLSLTGGTMSGAIALGSNKIVGLANGTTTGDAVAYNQLQNVAGPYARGVKISYISNIQNHLLWNDVILEDSSHNKIRNYAPGTLILLDISTSGAGGLDTGTVAANTFYYVWIISNGTTFTGLYSLSSTSPTLPGGYIYAIPVGCVLTDSSSHLLVSLQIGNVVQYGTIQTVLHDTTNNGVLVSGTSLAAFVPPNVSWIAYVNILFGSTYTIAQEVDLSIQAGTDYNSSANCPPLVTMSFNVLALTSPSITWTGYINVVNESTPTIQWLNTSTSANRSATNTFIYIGGYTLTAFTAS